jgi:hypothetical protein
MSTADSTPTPARGRSCGSCSLCCKLLGIPELNKPMGQWCPHCLKGSGCGIYDTRPSPCRTFSCGWLVSASFGEEWQPSRAKMFVYHVNDGGIDKLVVHVDPGTPLQWQREPYYSQLKRYAGIALEENGMVNIYVGKKVIVVLPNKDVDLGTFELGDKITMQKRRAGSGWDVNVFKSAQDAPAQQAAPPA